MIQEKVLVTLDHRDPENVPFLKKITAHFELDSSNTSQKS